MNKVMLKYRNKNFESVNNIHPEFFNAILQILGNGNYISEFDQSVMHKIFSIHPNYVYSSIHKDFSSITSASSVGIYAFSKSDSPFRFFNDNGQIKSEIFFFPLVSVDLYNNSTYSVTSSDNNRFLISQNFFYSPTADDVYSSIKIESFAIKTNFLRFITPSFFPRFLPFVYITSKKLIGDSYLEIFPGEMFKLDWVVDFNVDGVDDSFLGINFKSSVNNVNAIMHSKFKDIFTELMLSSTGYVLPNNTPGETFYFKINGIIGFSNPNGAIFNNGSTSNNSAFFMNPDVGTGNTLTASISSGILSYFVSYTNTTGEYQKLGSLLLSGGRISDVVSLVPISWISSKDLWGEEVRIISPNERIEFTWTINLSQNNME